MFLLAILFLSKVVRPYKKSNIGVYSYCNNSSNIYFVNETTPQINLDFPNTRIGAMSLIGNTLFITTFNPFQFNGSANESVIAVNVSSGRVLWRKQMSDGVMSQPITYKGMIIVGLGMSHSNNKNGLVALNDTTGNIIWIFSRKSETMPTPTLVNGLLFGAYGAGYYLINASNGNVIYIKNALPDMMSSPHIVKGTAYFGAGYTHSYSFYAVNVSTGKIDWIDNFPQAEGGMADIEPAIYNGIVISGFLNNSMYSNQTLVGMNMSTGKILWETSEVSASKQVPVIVPPKISSIVPSGRGQSMSAIEVYNGIGYSDSTYLGLLVAFSPLNGKVLWAFSTGSCNSGPTFYDNAAIIACKNGVVYAINASTGALINQVMAVPHSSFPLILTRNEVILGGNDGRIMSVSLEQLLKSQQVVS